MAYYTRMKITHTFAAVMIAASVSAPVAANASAADFLRTFFSLPYAAQEETRLAFPDELTVESWGNPTAQEVDTATLAKRAMSGIVPLRQGSHLVKFGNDPRVYAVSLAGTLHWIPSESAAVYLYGDSWSNRVVTLFESYYANYRFGQDAAKAHPDGTLIQYPERPTVYYVQSGSIRPFLNEEAFRANNLDFDSVVTVYHPYGYAEGMPIRGYEAELDLQGI